MIVGVLITVMIGMVVGVNLIPSIAAAINSVKNTPDVPSGLTGLLDVLLFVFVAIILLSAVAWIGGQG